MGEPHNFLTETHILGPNTTERRVGGVECEFLRSQHVDYCGISAAAPPYCMIRPRTEWSECVITLSGQGSVWVQGEWQPVTAGDAYLARIGSAQGFKAVEGQPWEFVWVHSNRPLYDVYPRVTRAEGSDLASVISALHHEVLGARDSTILMHLSAAISAYARRLGDPAADQRLLTLWRTVDANLAHPWTLEKMAAKAGVSPEHLRRLALSEQGMTPMRYVTELRLRRAAALLRSSQAKLEAIAPEVGYGSVYSFATAFKRWSGHAPGAWRGMT